MHCRIPWTWEQCLSAWRAISILAQAQSQMTSASCGTTARPSMNPAAMCTRAVTSCQDSSTSNGSRPKLPAPTVRPTNHALNLQIPFPRPDIFSVIAFFLLRSGIFSEPSRNVYQGCDELSDFFDQQWKQAKLPTPTISPYTILCILKNYHDCQIK